MVKMTFENPTNGYRETVSGNSIAGAFFLGPLYLLAKGLWTHALIWTCIAVALAMLAKPAVLILLPIYATVTPSLMKAHFLRKGWKDVSEEMETSQADPKEPKANFLQTGLNAKPATLAVSCIVIVIGLIGLAYTQGSLTFVTNENRLFVTDKLLMEMLRQDEPAPSSPLSVAKDIDFETCKERVDDTAKSIGAQTTTIIDDDKLYMLRFPMPHGSVIASCSALDAKLVVTRNPE